MPADSSTPVAKPDSEVYGTLVNDDRLADTATLGRVDVAEQSGFSGIYDDESAAFTGLLPPVKPEELIAGRFRIGAKLGEGGMGAVYQAEQLEPVRRQVAFKVMQPGYDTAQLLARFEAERQALALMDHPNIAKVLDAGSIPRTGAPYFVMELVSGPPLNDYCDQKRLTPRQRIELFLQVCQGVQHAHQKGIIHRDLKPSNILVVEYDGQPVPKIIDFGIAKAKGALLTGRTLETSAGSIVGTPEYMSPEQANPEEEDIDTRSDIYALGVILYELLTGGLPFDRRLLPHGLYELLRVIREEEPPTPSTKLGTETKASVAANRGVEPGQLARLVRGDLDWIVMKALAKERERRYQSANEFAQDLQRYLADEPVQASPPSRSYRLQKFIRRNKTMVAAAVLVLLALVAGMAGTTWGWLNAQKAWTAEALRAEQEKKAKEAAQAANAIAQGRLTQLQQFTRILAQIFVDANPRTAEKEGKSLYELFAEKLNAVTPLIDAETLRDPITAAELQSWLAYAHSGLGYPDRAVALLEKSYQTFKEKYGPDHIDTLRTQGNLGDNYVSIGKETLGRQLLEQTLQQKQRLLGSEHPETVSTMACLSIAYRKAGRIDLALPLDEEVLRRRRAALGDQHSDTLNAMQNLAVAYRVAGKHEQALTMLNDTWRLRKDTLGEHHPDTLRSAVNLGQTYGSLGKPELGLPILREALATLTTKLGREHPDTLACIGNLGMIYRQLGQHDLALPLVQEQYTLTKARLGPEHPTTLTALNNLALIYLALKRTSDALPLLEETYRLRRAKLGADHPDNLSAMNNLAAVYADVNRLDEAIAMYEEAVQLCENKLGRDHPHTLLYYCNLADCYEKQGQYAKALPLLKASAEGVEKLGFKHQNVGAILPAYLETLEKTGQIDMALVWWPKWIKLMKERRGDSPNTARQWTEWCYFLMRHGRYPEAEEQLRGCLALRRKLEPDHWMTFALQGRLGAALLAQKKYVDAEPVLLEAVQAIKDRERFVLPEDRHLFAASLASLIQLYTETNRAGAAEPWRRELRRLMPIPPAR